ncbi:pleiotropic regulator 1-like [Convolutriloba macropyga]|uniref:pleiotropic regulator 1-like n=1 Tax=Convolutriloba macropyga TaxID=536237 RepID=UPI003F51CB88
MASGVNEPVQKHTVHTLVFRSLKRTYDMFVSEQGFMPEPDSTLYKSKMSIKARDQYGPILHMPVDDPKSARKQHAPDAVIHPVMGALDPKSGRPASSKLVPADQNADDGSNLNDGALVRSASNQLALLNPAAPHEQQTKSALIKKAPTLPKPNWHPPWKLYRVISGHLGWVRSIAVDPTNDWFCTGSADRTIKIWDLASGKLRLSLTGHISAVRGLVVSPRQPYLFSCGEDKMVKCWDLEQNKATRHYHGHLSGVYAIDLHPTIDVLATCGRDATTRIWDMRTKACIHSLSGHSNTVSSVKCQAAEPQVITASHDSTIKLWDLAAGKCRATLTNHKKSVRGLVLHPKLYSFATASPDNIKLWKCPEGDFMQNFVGHNAIVNALGVNADNVLVSAADNGSMHFWDWSSGYCFQKIQAQVQPGSLDSEAGIYAVQFDQSGSRLITAEADKTIKVYKEDDTATEESHPVVWKRTLNMKKTY